MTIRAIIWTLFTAFFVFLVLPMQVEAAGLAAIVDIRAVESTAPLCRFGVNESEGDITAFDTGSLRLGWYIDYRAKSNPPQPHGIEHVQMIRLFKTGNNGYGYSPSGQTLLNLIDARSGTDWYIGNEPDRIKYQDGVEPHLYAAAYHELYELIKGRDPSAHIVAGSIVQATDVRLKYLDMVLDSYLEQFDRPMPVDGWSIHGFILNEVSCDAFPGNDCWGAEIPPGLDDTTGLEIDVQQTDDQAIFEAQIRRFRQWMADRGFRDTPLYMSEYGVLMPSGIFSPDFDSARVNKFMDGTFDFLLSEKDSEIGYPADGNLLVQKLSWYSTGDQFHPVFNPLGFNGHLFDTYNGNSSSAMGDNFAAYVAQVSEEIDLHITRLEANPPSPSAGAGNATITLTAHVANGGNLLAGTPTIVRFYDGDPQAGGQQIGNDQPLALSGCGERLTVDVQWADVTPGDYTVYAVVDPDDQVAETGPLPNKASRSIFFSNSEVLLPIVGR